MDQERIIATLEWWVKHALKARTSVSDYGASTFKDYVRENDAKHIELVEREDQTRRVLQKVLRLRTLPTVLESNNSGQVWLDEGIKLCRYALGRIRTEADTIAMLGPTAPTMAADQLHGTIWGTASVLWDDGHYRAGVQKAATQLNAEVQFKTGRHDLSDVQLMQQVFSLSAPDAGKRRLRWPGNDDDLTVKAMRNGILWLAQGVYSAIRNTATHSTEELPRQVAFEQLATLSTLARWIDECEVLEA